jgi:hypothetical protein
MAAMAEQSSQPPAETGPSSAADESIRFVPAGTTHRAVLFAALAIGAAIRLAPALVVGSSGPTGLGGLFMEFSQRIAENGYRLPAWIPFYTDGGIPFAYPPLPFYFEAFFIDIFGLSPFLAANSLPALMAVASLFALRRLTLELAVSETTRLFILVAFAVMPGTVIGHIEAAGLSESFGLTALLAFGALLAACWSDAEPRLLRHLWIGGAWGLCVVASPGSAALSILIWLIWFAPSAAFAPASSRLRAIGYRVVSGLVALLVSSPYWLAVVAHHGWSIFVNTLATQQQGGLSTLLNKVLFNLGFEPLAVGSAFPIVGTGLVIAGAWVAAHRRLHALWIALVLASIVPREAEWLVAIPGAILMGLCLGEIVMPAVVNGLRGRDWTAYRVTALAIAILLGLNLIINLGLALASEAWWRPSLSPEFLEATAWVSRNVPEDARFVTIGSDAALEWSPHLAQRTVVNVPYGTEWRPELQPAILGLWAGWQTMEDAWTVWSVTRKAFGLETFGVIARSEKIREFATHDDARVNVEVYFDNGSWAVARLAPRQPADNPS